MPTTPVVRVVQAGLGPEAQVRLVLSGVDDPKRLRAAWATSGAAVDLVGDRLHATSTRQALSRAAGRAFGAPAARRLEAVLQDALAAWAAGPPPVALARGRLTTDARPLVMGVVNVTPDSFSDGGCVYPQGHPDAAVALGRRLLSEGADLIDVGGESSRPGSDPVEVNEELARVVPVVRALVTQGAVVSIDTTKARVAEAGLAAGAAIVNDVSGGASGELLAATARRRAAYVLMHTRGTPKDMQHHTDYDDVLAEVTDVLAAGLRRCTDAGIAAERVLVDPGIGFAKTPRQNLQLLRGLRQLRSLGRPLVVGASRKSFLGTLLDGAGPQDRLEGSLACAASAVSAGAAVLRVHDVAQTVRVARVAHAIATGGAQWPPAGR